MSCYSFYRGLSAAFSSFYKEGFELLTSGAAATLISQIPSFCVEKPV
jgi:hypothetical protein